MKALSVNCEYVPRYNENNEIIMDNRVENANNYYKNPKLAYINYDLPELKPNEVLIRVKKVGICGSDYHSIQTDSDGYIIFSGAARFPQILGHEFAGYVEDMGSNVPYLSKGDMVACESVLWCGHCPHCREGNYSQCRNVELVGLTVAGAFKEFIIMPHTQVWKINDLTEIYDEETALKLGALLEPIGCAYKGIFLNGLNKAHIRSSAAVYGAGPIGLSAAWLLALSGIKNVYIFEIIPERIEIAKSMGFKNVINPNEVESISYYLLKETQGKGIDISVECSGAAHKIIPEIVKSTAARGEIIYLSRTGSKIKSVYVDFDMIMTKGNYIIGSRGHAGTFPSILKILSNREHEYISKMITKEVEFDHLLSFLEEGDFYKEGKVIVNIK